MTNVMHARFDHAGWSRPCARERDEQGSPRAAGIRRWGGVQGSGICTPRWAACIAVWGRGQPIGRRRAGPAGATTTGRFSTPPTHTQDVTPSNSVPLHDPPPPSLERMPDDPSHSFDSLPELNCSKRGGTDAICDPLLRACLGIDRSITELVPSRMIPGSGIRQPAASSDANPVEKLTRVRGGRLRCPLPTWPGPAPIRQDIRRRLS